MSFILDALKKSENERQRNVGPSLADVQVRRRVDDRPWWAVAVAALLVINLGVLIVVLMRRDDERAAAPQSEAAQTQPNRAAPTGPAATSAPAAQRVYPSQPSASEPSNPAVHSLADEANAGELEPTTPTDTGLSAASVVPEGPPMVRPIEAPAVAPAPARPTFDARSAAAPEVLPTHNDITASGTTLPDMHLDIHVHSNNPAERFVFVNMRKYVEGQTLSEGSVVERITPEGVVLNHRGLRFLLPRQ